MNTVLREIYEHLPDTVPIPEHLRRQRGEVIILPLDAEPSPPPGMDGDRRRRALLDAWSCVTPAQSAESIDRDLSALREEWAHRP